MLQRDPANERDQIFVSDHSRNVLRVSTNDGQEPIAQAVPITSDHVRDLNENGSCRVAIDGRFGGRWAALRAVVAMAHRATNRAATTSDRSAAFELPHRPTTRSAGEAARFAREAELRAFRLKMAGLRR
ncbi:MAG: hypothetical protein R3F20_00690 [Planctomycetota bacterium]